MKLTPVSTAFAVVTANCDLCSTTAAFPAPTSAAATCVPLFPSTIVGVAAAVVTSCVPEFSLTHESFSARTR